MNNRVVFKYIAVFIVLVLLLMVLGNSLNQRAYDFGEDVFNRSAKDIQNIRNQFLTMILFMFLGLVFVFPFMKKIGTSQGILLSFPLSILLFEFISIDFLMYGIKYNLAFVMIVYVLVIAILYFISIKMKISIFNISKQDKLKIGFSYLYFVVIAYFLSAVPISTTSFDSYSYKLLGFVYAHEHMIADYASQAVSGYTMIPSLLNSISCFFGFEYSYAILNMFILCGVLLFGYFVYKTSRQRAFDKRKSFLFMVITTLLLSTSFFFVFLGICLLQTVLSGLFVMFMLYYIKQYMDYGDESGLILSLIFCLAFCFTRVEGALVTCFILGFLVHEKIDVKSFMLYSGCVLLCVAVWYISFFARFGTDMDSAFLTFDKGVLVFTLFALLLLYAFLKQKFFNKYNDILCKFYMSMIVLMTVILHLLDMTKIVNFLTMFKNMFYSGFWTIGWVAVLVLAIIAVIITKKKDMFYEINIFMLILVFFSIFTFRDKLLGDYYADSGNRMMMHIYPLIYFSLYENITSFFKKNDE